MKIVMLYSVSDGCTFTCDQAKPIEYASPEAALVDFCKIAQQTKEFKKTTTGDFHFAGFQFNTTDFTFMEPNFLTIDEWFNQYGAQS